MVHQYKLNGYNIVLDTVSGSVHTVDEVAYDIIAMYKTATREEIVSKITEKYPVSADEVAECIADVEYLEENGKLFTEDKFEKLAYTYKNNSNVIKAMLSLIHI